MAFWWFDIGLSESKFLIIIHFYNQILMIDNRVALLVFDMKYELKVLCNIFLFIC